MSSIGILDIHRSRRLRRRNSVDHPGSALAADAAFRDRFTPGVTAADDPHNIRVFEAGETYGVLFIAMRYMPAEDVRTLVRRARQELRSPRNPENG